MLLTIYNSYVQFYGTKSVKFRITTWITWKVRFFTMPAPQKTQIRQKASVLIINSCSFNLTTLPLLLLLLCRIIPRSWSMKPSQTLNS